MSKITTWLRRIAAIEPVYVRSIIGAIITAAAVWGVDLADYLGRFETTIQQVIILCGLVVTVVGIRDKVTPTAAVVARVQDPTVAPDAVSPEGAWLQPVYLAGGYAEAPTGSVVGRRSRIRDLTNPHEQDVEL